MPHLQNLILSIRDTYDPQFSHGLIMESTLIKYIPDLKQFNYKMTHRISDKTLIEEFVRWSMNSVFYSNNNSKWIHIFSVPNNICIQA